MPSEPVGQSLSAARRRPFVTCSRVHDVRSSFRVVGSLLLQNDFSRGAQVGWAGG